MKKRKKILRMKDLPEKVNLSRSTIYTLIKEGKFPKSKPLIDGENPPMGFLESDIDDWIDSKFDDGEEAIA